MKSDRDKSIPHNIELEIDGISSQGQGVGRYQGLALFVAGALPGERVRAQVTRQRKNYAQARLIELLRPAPGRTEPACPAYACCGGCSLLHADYQLELELKRRILEQSLSRLAGLNLKIPLPLASQPHRHYRNRVVLHYHQGRLGFYDSASHSLSSGGLPDDCLLPHQSLLRLTALARRTLSSYEKELRGLRGLALRCNSEAAELMLSFLCDRPLPVLPRLTEALTQSEPSLRSVWQNSGPPAYGVYGAGWRLLSGREKLSDSIGNIKIELSPASFCQVNPTQTLQLYQAVRDFAAPKGSRTLLDLYSGVGCIALHLAARAQQVIGVESYGPAVADAEHNAGLNHIANCSFIKGEAEDVLPRLAAQGQEADTVVLDPPRSGCAPALLHALARVGPERVVYVSCDPATLARDLSLLATLGYETRQVRPVDMFPCTAHLETVVLLVKK